MVISVIDIGMLGDMLNRDELRKLGDVRELSSPDVMKVGPVEALKDTEVVLGGFRFLTPEVMDQLPNLKLVVIPATGFNAFDIEHARKCGISVANNPDYGTQPVAQHAIALLLYLTNQIAYYNDAIRSGDFMKTMKGIMGEAPLMELANKTLGVIGFGRIGRNVGKMAAGLGMKVIAYDIFENDEGRKIAEYTTLDDLLARSDVVSLNCPSTKENRHIINAGTIAKMKDGAILINDARGDLVDEQALADALKSGKIRGAGLDVVEKEPFGPENPLFDAPNCVVTPHIAWSPVESRQRMADAMIDTVRAFVNGTPINIVN